MKKINFIILQQPVPEEIYCFTFYASLRGNYSNLLGQFHGNVFKDHAFAQKLARVRARIALRNVSFHESVYRIENIVHKRRTDKERFDTKMKKTWKLFWLKIDQIKLSNPLFYSEQVAGLCQEYKYTCSVLRARYNQTT